MRQVLWGASVLELLKARVVPTALRRRVPTPYHDRCIYPARDLAGRCWRQIEVVLVLGHQCHEGFREKECYGETSAWLYSIPS